MGVNTVTSLSFLTTTIFVIVKSFRENHPVFAVILSLVCLAVNLSVYVLGSKHSILRKSYVENDRLLNTIDSSLIKNGFFKTFFYNKSGKGRVGVFYYPTIEKTVQPLFSKKGLFNPFVYRIIFTQALFSHLFILYSQQQSLLKEVVVTAFICCLLSMVWYLWLNKDNYRAFVSIAKDSALNKDIEPVITMDRSVKQTQRLLKKEFKSSLTGTPLDTDKDAVNTLWSLYYDAIQVVFEFNDFKAVVLNKNDFFQESIDDISYIINELLPKRINATNLFFNSYGEIDSHSVNVFKSEVSSKMHKEFVEYNKKLRKFKETLTDAKEIDKKYIAQNIYLDDRIEDTKHINVDAVSNHLYPELRGLEFSSLKNRVAAQNISSNLLPELHSLLELAENQEDVDDIKSQIEDVKRLLFSLSDAKPTENKDGEDVLSLTSNQENRSIISQTLNRQKIYMRSYKDKV